MTTTETDAAKDTPPPEGAPEPAPDLARPVRRKGRTANRVLAVASLVVAFGTVGYVVTATLEPSTAAPLEVATDDAWTATGELSDALRALRPGQSRNDARPLAGAAADAVAAATKEVEALDLETSETPLRSRVLRALRADAAWIDAVGSTLANPASARRAELSELAKDAATATALVQQDLDGAEDTVGGTGRLLAATKPGA